jgi:hypothetical protein
MRTLTENLIEEDGLKIEFFGWTNYGNAKYIEISDEISTNLDKGKEKQMPLFIPKPGKEDYVELLRRSSQLAELMLINRLFIKGIKFDGTYHQDGEFGCPLFKINDLGIFKWSCSFRSLGEVMEHAGYGLSYCDWAWESPEIPVTPDMIEEKTFLINNQIENL